MPFDYDSGKKKARDNFNQQYRGAKLKMLSAKNGGSIVEILSKTDATQTPTLIIGLGGLGGQTVNLIKKKYIENIRDDETNPRIQFLALDVDKDAMSKLDFEKTGGYLKSNEIGNMLVDITATHKLLEHLLQDKIDSPVQQWVDKKFNPTRRINLDGAQATRQIGRLILSVTNNYIAVESLIRNKIESLLDASKGKISELTIIIVAGISGGTGSGTVVDISYMVHKVATAVLGEVPFHFDAIFYTPDVQFNVPEIKNNASTIKNLKRNFTAAMKEIDTFFKLEETNGEYTFPCAATAEDNGKLMSNGTNIGKKNIYKSITLVQGYDTFGTILDIDIPMETVANYIVSIMGDFNDTNSGKIVQTLKSVFSNDDSNRTTNVDNIFKVIPTLPRDSIYQYRALGFQTLTFPVEEIITILANKTMIKLDEKFRKAYTGNVLEALTLEGIAFTKKDNGIYIECPDRKKLYERVFSTCGFNANAVDNIVSGFNFNSIIHSNTATIKNSLNPQKNIRTDILDSVVSGILKHIEAEMRKSGPYAAIRFSTVILGYIETMVVAKSAVQNYYEEKSKQFSKELDVSYKKLTDMNKISAKLLHSKKIEEEVERFRQTARNYYIAESKRLITAQVAAFLQSVINEVTTVHNNEWEYFVGAFCMISEVLQDDSTAAVNTATHDGGHVFSAALLNIKDLEDDNSHLGRFINHWLSDDYINRICGKLIENMLEKKKAWSADNTDFNAVEELRELFNQQFKSFIKNTIEKFLIVQYADLSTTTIDDLIDAMETSDIDTNDPVQGPVNWKAFENHCVTVLGMKTSPIQSAAQAIYNKVNSVGKCAAESGAGATVDFGKFFNDDRICLMSSMPHINEAIEAIMSKEGKTPCIGNFPGIYHLQVYCGIPLYLFKGMDDNQRVYAECLKNPEVNPGMHMDASDEAGWKKFSPVISNKALGVVFSGTDAYKARADYQAEDEILRDIKKKTDYCLENGMLTEDKANAFYYMRTINTEFTDTAKCRAALVSAYRTDVEKTINSLGSIPANSPDPEKAWRTLFDSAFSNKKLCQLMQENGYTLDSTKLDLRNVYASLDQSTLNDYNHFTNVAKNDGGGLYITIRKSTGFRNALNKCFEECCALNEELDKIREELIETAMKEAVKIYAHKNCLSLIELFAKSFVMGHIDLKLDKESEKIYTYFYEDLKYKQKAVVLGEGTLILSGAYESRYFVYGAFTSFYAMAMKNGTEWISGFTISVEDEFVKASNDGRMTKKLEKELSKHLLIDPDTVTDAVLEIVPEKELVLLSKNVGNITFPVFPPNSRINCADDINSAFENKPAKIFADMDKLPLYDENDRIGNSVGGQIICFYEKLAGIINPD